MSVARRETELLEDLEYLLDSREQDIPPSIYSELVSIYDNLNDEIPQLENDLEEAHDKIIELANEKTE